LCYYSQADNVPGTTVFTFDVSDDDLDPNGAPFMYDIVSGDPLTAFSVDSSGVIKTALKLNREIISSYNLTVRVVDNGEPPLYVDVVVTVTVVEESHSPPVVTPLKIFVTAFGDSFEGGVIGRVKVSVVYCTSTEQLPLGSRIVGRNLYWGGAFGWG